MDIIPSAGFSLESLLRGAIGMATLVAIAYAFSSNRKAVNWKVVGVGLSIQLLLAIGVIYVDSVQNVFKWVGSIFINIMDFTKAGTGFLFSSFGTGEIESPLINFAVMILPTIIFFSAITSVLFYMGIIQKIVKGLAWLLTKALKISGAESLSVAGNIFLGQTEAPLMIKKYLDSMNRSEILLVMIGGMATVAGGVLAAYVGFLGGEDKALQLFYAKHLLAASVMAAPGAIVVAKILMPQTEAIESNIEISNESVGTNFLDALTNGTSEGLKLAMNVGAMLLVFFSFIALVNFILSFLGTILNLASLAGLVVASALGTILWMKKSPELATWKAIILSTTLTFTLYMIVMSIGTNYYGLEAFDDNFNLLIANNTSYNNLSLEFIFGHLFAPLMWLIGVATEDITKLGQLLGVKIIASEFVGYENLATLKDTAQEVHLMYDKSILMATYMLCGFANFASIGIQVGGIGSLAPGQRKTLSEFGVKALIGGTLASLFSATMAGMLVG